MTLVKIAAEVVACVLLADFLSGLFHWLEDAYGQPHWPVTGRLITQPNILHHHNPTEFTRHSWLKSADVLLVLGGLILAGAAAIGRLQWQIVLVVAIGVNANEFHKWAHRPRAKNPRLVNFLHDCGVLQSPAHHARHHRDPKNSHYCVITNLLNPVLDRARFWLALERTLFWCFGLKRRHDPSVAPPRPK
jgi:ubiquitin-conjugating enzyme E2 variant